MASVEDYALNMKSDLSVQSNLTLSELSELSKKSPNEVLHFILDNRSDFLFILKEKNTEQGVMSYAIIALGMACTVETDLRKHLNEFMITISSYMDYIAINIQRLLVSFNKQKILDKYHLDALLYLTEFLKTFQLTLPSTSLNSISILLPLLVPTCNKCLKDHDELRNTVTEKLKGIQTEQEQFFEHHSLSEIKKESENEKLHLEEPPENYRSLSILPTVDDVDLPCLFLRPNIVKGRYKDTEHYLDVQFRLLREDYIKPLRDGIAEYLSVKKKKQPLRNCKNARVYSNAFIESERFVDGELLYTIKFKEAYFSEINWETSKRFLTGNLLCLSTDDFRSMLFATVIRRDPEELREGLLLVKFEEMTEEVLNLNPSIKFVVLETSALFESYRHNLNVLQQLNEETLSMKRYIVDVEKNVNKPHYLQPTTVYDMRPLLIPLNETCLLTIRYPRMINAVLKNVCPKHLDVCKSVKVTDDSSWPTASMLNLDESQYLALKSAITKEFAIIQGPPGTGKTYVGLRTVQLLLHNINCWFHDDSDSLPILIVCYTNHALDQFLEGILNFTQRIVRIGGRVSNEVVGEYQIKKLVKSASIDMPQLLFDKISETKSKIRKLKENINAINDDIESSKRHILTEFTLKDYLSPAHYKSLRLDDVKHCKRSNINDWLQIGVFDETVTEKSDQNRYPNTAICKPSEEVEGDGEVDIEFIENQRNVDFYDFKDTHVLERKRFDQKSAESCEQEWKYQKRNKQKIAKYISNSLQNSIKMKRWRALRIRNVWNLSINERWQLYKFWLEEFIEGERNKFIDLQEQLKVACKDLSDARTEVDLLVVKRAHVVGMTTTGAAKYRHIIEARNPVILIVEEAAEILESHIITSLAPKTQHVILIGDQQQLQPSPTVYMLAVKYGMNISLFERMIKNGMAFCRLSIQHRMRPEIAALISPHIYTHLENHKIVTEFENIKGVTKNVFFVTHNFNELLVQDSKSKVNEHEAKFLIKLCQYLLLQDYEPSQITVLTTYSGQLFALKKLATGDVKEVRFTVVDNFQGEENDIILISFVRSNNEGEVGFLKVSNRICVALSRAKKGLYCIGNFELLAEKSKLWKNILQTLSENKSIGTSLCLKCQNHPDMFNEVTNDTDFASVPDGGCIRKCEYRLTCGHSCVLSCHPYDRAHVDIECKKPCSKVCKDGHQCPKKCFEDCGFCPVLVDKILSRCGHTVRAPCGKNEWEIRCENSCSKTCKKGHPCPKKCFQSCGECQTLIDRKLSRCGHTVNAACGKTELAIKCQNPCGKTCEEGHPCPKKCFEQCGPCKTLIDKTLTRCGHTVNILCSEPENEVKCTLQCKQVLSCLHQCKNKCYEPCVKECLQLIEIESPVCGHTLTVECYISNNLEVLSKKCSEPCKGLLPCDHVCKGTCSGCKQGIAHLKCKEPCKKNLQCGHGCSKKCSEPCVIKCLQMAQIQSPVCGHFLKIKCHFTSCLNKLAQECSEPCEEILPCGHICKGTCGSCYQGRLHISCEETCERILICGHKCQSRCFKSCPPCGKPCENSCIHGRCRRKCGYPCTKCTRPCTWICSHKKCTRRCSEICDREPCNELCPKILSCNHPCVGFCGEPCPKQCLICNNKLFHEKSKFSKNDNCTGYVYLEDCGHIFNEQDLNKWLSANSEGMQEIRMKTCPNCKTIIRRNVRFGKIIKQCVTEIEKVKQKTQWVKNENLKIQRDLLQQVNVLQTEINDLYSPITKVLSSEYVRNVHELSNVANVINIAREIEWKTYGIYSMFISSPFLDTLVDYTRSCREWLIDFIRDNFLTVSEFQLMQMSREVHRLTLLDFLLKFANQKHFASLSPEVEKSAASILTYKPFTDDSVKSFETAFKSFVESFHFDFETVPIKCNLFLKSVSMSGSWYQCPKKHITCVAECDNAVRKICYECDKNTDPYGQSINRPLSTNVEIANDVLSNNDSCVGETSKSKLNVKECTKKYEGLHRGFVQKVFSNTVVPSDRNSGMYRRPVTLSQSFQSKELNVKRISEQKSCNRAVQGNSDRKRNEQFSVDSETIRRSVSAFHYTKEKTPVRTYPRPPINPSRMDQHRKVFHQEESKRNNGESNEEMLPNSIGEYRSSSLGTASLRGYRHRNPRTSRRYPIKRF